MEVLTKSHFVILIDASLMADLCLVSGELRVQGISLESVHCDTASATS